MTDETKIYYDPEPNSLLFFVVFVGNRPYGSRWGEERSADQDRKSYFCPECAKSLINAKFGLRIRVRGKIDLPSGTIFGRPAVGGTSVVIRRKPCDLLPIVNGDGRRYKPVCVIGREGQMCYGKPRCTTD